MSGSLNEMLQKKLASGSLKHVETKVQEKGSTMDIDEKAVEKYQKDVLDATIEKWVECLGALTFDTFTMPISRLDAVALIVLYRDFEQKRNPAGAAAFSDNANLDRHHQLFLQNNPLSLDAALFQISDLQARLQVAIDSFIGVSDEAKAKGFFVKTSSRSPKDAPAVGDKLRSLFLTALERFDPAIRSTENSKTYALLEAGTKAMRVFSAEEALTLLCQSERIWQDMCLALDLEEKEWNQSIVLRRWVEIDCDMEFRGFYCNKQLNALSQYNYLIHSERLVRDKQIFQDIILDTFNSQVLPRLQESQISQCVVDFAVVHPEDPERRQVFVIEINPFVFSTDAALFQWSSDAHLLSNGPFQLRIVEKPVKGVRNSISINWRDVFDSV